MNLRNKKKLILILLIFCCCFVAVGYFVVIRSVVVQGKVKIEEPVWNVKFEEIKTMRTIGKASNYQKPRLDDHVINFFADFKEVNDSITYKIKIANRGNLNAELASINFFLDGKEYIDCELKGLTVGDKLKSSNTVDIEVTLKYTGENIDNIQELNDVKLLLNWKQAI